jgi:hypothetical protein
MGAATSMTTWRLWRALKYPPVSHPVFRRVTSAYHEEMYGLNAIQNFMLQAQVWFWPMLFLLDTRALIFMVFSGTIYGAIWTLRISGTVAMQRADGMDELLGLSPSGRIGMNWAICTGCLHRHAVFEQVNSQEAWSTRLILFVPLIISANVWFGQLLPNSGIVTVIWLGAFIALLYLDHVQSIIIGCLLGVLIPQRATSRFDAQLFALIGFIILQLLTYLTTIIIAFILPVLYNSLHIAGIYTELTLPIFSVLVFFGLREGIMVWVWHQLIHELNAVPTELDSMFRKPYPGEWTAAL